MAEDYAGAVAEFEEILTDISANPLSTLTLLPHQAEFLLCPSNTLAAILSNQNGKSHGAATLVVWTARGDWPQWMLTGKDVPVRRTLSWLKDHSVFADRMTVLPDNETVICYEDWSDRFPRLNPPRRATSTRIIVPNYKVSAGLIDKLSPDKPDCLLPRGHFTARKNAGSVYGTWEVDCIHGDKSSIELISDEGGELVGEGWVGDLVVIDEPCSHARYAAHRRGLMAKEGRMIFTLTPLMPAAWIKEAVVDKAAVEQSIHVVQGVSIYANCRENGGFLRRDRIEEFLRDVPPSELPAREHGVFMHVAARIFQEFDSAVHVFQSVEDFGGPSWWQDAIVTVLHDPHPRRAPVLLFFAIGHDQRILIFDEYPRVRPDGQPYIYREVQVDPHGAEKLVKAEEAILTSWSVREYDEYVDPRGGAAKLNEESPCWIDMMADHGHVLTPAPVSHGRERSEVAEGVRLVREWLLWDQSQALGPTNRPRLGVLAHCHNTRWAFENWGYAEAEGTDTKFASEERWAEKGKDQIDCCRYYAFTDPVWQPRRFLSSISEPRDPHNLAGY